MMGTFFKELLPKVLAWATSWLLGRLMPSPGSTGPSIEAVAQREKDRADAAEQTIVDIARGKAARDRVRNDADDIVRDRDNAG